MIRKVRIEDAARICNIYNYYVRHSISTFEEQDIKVEEMQKRIMSVSSVYPYIVFEIDNNILGYAYASEWNKRSAYGKTVEVSVYLDPENTGKGFGTLLYTELIKELKAIGYHVLIGGISLPNPGSIKLHENFGFEKVAHFKEVGYKFDQWIDVGYWQLIL